MYRKSQDMPHFFKCDECVSPVSIAPSQLQEAQDFCNRVRWALLIIAVAVAVITYVCY